MSSISDAAGADDDIVKGESAERAGTPYPVSWASFPACGKYYGVKGSDWIPYGQILRRQTYITHARAFLTGIWKRRADYR